MKLISCLLSVSLLAGMASVAQAEGLYVGLEGGITFSQKNKFSYKSSTKTGYTLVTALGYDLGLDRFGSIRPELEFSYRYNPSEKIKKLQDSQKHSESASIDVNTQSVSRSNTSKISEIIPTKRLLQSQVRATIQGGTGIAGSKGAWVTESEAGLTESNARII
ncbi:MAG: hypothetical protein LBS66_03560, partial [Rhodospirillaceae bacterium]|nr:hypothetical protein [Rhodospirillaceae bacterium]